MTGTTNCTKKFLLIPVTMKSSAYRINRTFSPNSFTSNFSIPSSTILQIMLDKLPPCGIPFSVWKNLLYSTYPHFRNFLRITLSIGICSKIHSWLILSKHDFISDFIIHAGHEDLDRMFKHSVSASRADLFGR